MQYNSQYVGTTYESIRRDVTEVLDLLRDLEVALNTFLLVGRFLYKLPITRLLLLKNLSLGRSRNSVPETKQYLFCF